MALRFYEDNENREKRVTDLLVQHLFILDKWTGFEPPYVVCTQLNRKRYGRVGDVDIAIFKFKSNSFFDPANIEEKVCFEVKVSFFTPDGKFRSLKEGAHLRQIENLKEENWDRIYLLDAVVTVPADTYFHGQTFDVSDSFSKKVGTDECGHILLIHHGVTGRPEEETGGFGNKVLIEAPRREIREQYVDVGNGFCQFLAENKINAGGFLYVIYDRPESDAEIKIMEMRFPGIIAPMARSQT